MGEISNIGGKATAHARAKMPGGALEPVNQIARGVMETGGFIGFRHAADREYQARADCQHDAQETTKPAETRDDNR